MAAKKKEVEPNFIKYIGLADVREVNGFTWSAENDFKIDVTELGDDLTQSLRYTQDFRFV